MVNIFCTQHFKFRFWSQIFRLTLHCDSCLLSDPPLLSRSKVTSSAFSSFDWSITIFFSLTASQSQIDVFRSSVSWQCLCELFSLCLWQITITLKNPNAEIAIRGKSQTHSPSLTRLFSGRRKAPIFQPRASFTSVIVIGTHNALIYSSRWDIACVFYIKSLRGWVSRKMTAESHLLDSDGSTLAWLCSEETPAESCTGLVCRGTSTVYFALMNCFQAKDNCDLVQIICSSGYCLNNIKGERLMERNVSRMALFVVQQQQRRRLDVGFC